MSTTNWYDAFPSPRAGPASVTHDVLREMIEESVGDEDTAFVVVDLRRTDYTEHCIAGAINIPAQSFYPSIPTLSKVFGDRTIIFHCGSSRGRASRCAAWYQDYLDDNSLPGEAAILDGGIIEWLKHYAGNDTLTTTLNGLS